MSKTTERPTSLDPRLFQIFFLLSVLTLGVLKLDFPIPWSNILLVLFSAYLCQRLLERLVRIKNGAFSSTLITALSMLLLLRAQNPWLLVAATLLGVGSKYFLRLHNKHYFNPSNFGIVVMLLFTHRVWVSPGQWGENTLLTFWIAAIAFVLLGRVRRYDISLAFLLTYAALILFRIWYLGQASAVFWHQLKSGSLLIFTFYMISDPKTTPNHPRGRILFASSVALLAYYFKYFAYSPNALLYALFLLSPLTLIIDSLWKYSAFNWSNTGNKTNETARMSTPGLVRSRNIPSFVRFLRVLRSEGR